MAIVPQAPPGASIAAGSVFNGNWASHGAGLTIGSDGRVAMTYRTFNFCGPTQLPGLCDALIGDLIIDGGAVGATITSISGDTASTAVSFDPGNLATGPSTQMVYDPSDDTITYLGVTFCGTRAPAGECGA